MGRSLLGGPWFVIRGPWFVGRGSWAVVRGPWFGVSEFRSIGVLLDFGAGWGHCNARALRREGGRGRMMSGE